MGNEDQKAELPTAEIQELFMEYQTAEQQLKQLQEEIENVTAKEGDVHMLLVQLGELKHMESESELLVPFANGIFTKATMVPPKTLMVNVGSEIVVEKTLDETIGFVKEQMEEILEYKAKLEEQYTTKMQRLHTVEEKLQKLIN